MDLDMNGLMIETHHHPEIALSDANQQITPKNLSKLIDNLILRKKYFENNILSSELNNFRKKIDNLDMEIVEKVNLRIDLVEKIAELKMKNDLTIFQIERWFEILKNRKEQAIKLGVDPKMITDIFELIHKYSILIQSKIMKK
jgi:chorismate mutase